MYILLEKADARDSGHIINWDCMGYSKDVYKALEWAEANKEYRTIKFCPEREI